MLVADRQERSKTLDGHRDLSCLQEVTRVLGADFGDDSRGESNYNPDLKDILQRTLETVCRSLNPASGCIYVTSNTVGEVRVELMDTPDEGGTEIGVPIYNGEKTVGEILIRDPHLHGSLRERAVSMLNVVAALLSQAIHIRSFPRTLAPGPESETGDEVKFHPKNMVGMSKAMQTVYESIHHVTQSNTTVLILGESGVGKELVAHAIHRHSARGGKPFVKVNCAALPESLLESELFGHERGSFTGAIQQKKGRFELAEGGTVFLDEVGDFSPMTQVKLLRVLQEREFERLGGCATMKTDVRIIAATNRDLESMITAGLFRQDLYYRLNVFPIRVPPLKERKTDILLLADFFVEKYNKVLNKRVRRISTPAIDMMMTYHWPGNVRELENCIERAVLVSTDSVLHSHQLPPSLQTADTSGTRAMATLPGALAALEKELLLDALKATRGNMAQAARELGVSERMMGLRVLKYAIDPKRFRETRPPAGR